MKVLTFSKVFPQKHINAGEPTNFKEKILSGEKIHTIRPETTKWKIGDKISMRYWTGKPYHSKQEILEQEWYWNRPLRTTNIYYRLWFLRRKIRPLLPWLIG